MILTRAQIKNFRSIADATISFEPRCRILVGVNESGKSNILQALALIDPKRKINAGDRREVGENEEFDQEAFIRFVFSPEKSDYDKIANDLPSRTLCADIDPPILEAKDGRVIKLSELPQIVKEVLHKIDINEQSRANRFWNKGEEMNRDFKLVGRWYTPKKEAEDSFFEHPEFDQEVSLSDVVFAREEKDGWSPPEDLFVLVNPARVYDRVAAIMSELIRPPECIFWTYKDEFLLPGKIDLAAFTNDPSTCVPLQQIFLLAGIADPKETLLGANKRPNAVPNILNRVATIATKHLHKVWPESSGVFIELRQNGSSIDASVRDKFNSYDFSRRSDGFKRFVSFLLLVSAKHRADSMQNILYLHDEPEIGLHPSGARYLCDELIRISQLNYVVFSTHSIFMVDRENVSRHLLIHKEKETTSIKEVRESDITDEEVVYKALGYSMFDVLKPKNIIFEGWKDKKLFNMALESQAKEIKRIYGKFEGVGRCHAIGVKDIARVGAFLELANRRFIVVSDCDNVAHQFKQKHAKGYVWFTYNDLLGDQSIDTVEDFLTDIYFEKTVTGLASQIVEIEGVTTDILHAPTARIKKLKEWLKGKGLSQDLVNERMETIKNALFDSLAPTDIGLRYFKIVSLLAEHLEKTD
jgi:hypothetical protein